MSAHPMIQPTDWTITPESVVGSIPEVRQRLYSLIWNSAIACCLVAPLLHRHRTVWEVEGHPVGFLWHDVSSEHEGYWLVRQDFPEIPFSNPSAPSQPPDSISGVRVEPEFKMSFGWLISQMQLRGIGTPASIAGLLEDSYVGEDALLISDGDDLQLSPQAEHSLPLWQQAGLALDNLALFNETIADLESGACSTSQALDQAGLTTSEAEAIANDINAYAESWAGLSRNEGWTAITQSAAVPPRLNWLPKELDPEFIFPQDHPLRALRQEMESALAVQIPQWYALDNQERINHRLDWLKANHPDDLPSNSEGEHYRFNTLFVWLCSGIPSER